MEFQVSDTKALGGFYLNTLPAIGIPVKMNLDKLNKFIKIYGMKYAYVAVVGSNPSQASSDNTPFHSGTKSRQTINSWFEQADFNYRLKFVNIVNYKKIDNKPLTKSEINEHLPNILNRFKNWNKDALLVAVGKDAQYGLEQAGIEHFKMPHPSGLNRFWNDKEAGGAKIKEMLEWLKTSHYQMVKKSQDL